MTENRSSSSNVLKVKPSTQTQGGGGGGGGGSGSSSKGKMVSSSSNSKQTLDMKQYNKSTTTVTKSQGRDKTSMSSSRTTTKTTMTVKSQKKAYTLPGQKYDPPEEREPLRIFYESLSEQIPSSEMAAFWMMEHGLLSPDRAKKAYERKQKRQQQLRMGTPNKAMPKLNTPESSQKQQASKNGDLKGKRKLLNGSDDDDDFIVKRKKERG